MVVLDDNAIAGEEYTCMWNISLQIFGEAGYFRAELLEDILYVC